VLDILPDALSSASFAGGRFCAEDIDSIVDKQRKAHYAEFLASLKAADHRVQIYDGMRVFCDDRSCIEGDEWGVLFWSGSSTAGGHHVNVRGSEKMLADFATWARGNLTDGASAVRR
jgi:hypothetical protein